MENIGERIARLRESKGLSQRKLMEKFKFDNLSKYEKNQRKPNYEILKSLSEYFEVSIDYLINGESEDKESAPSETIYSSDAELKSSLRKAIIEGSNSANKEMSLNLTSREQDLVLAFRQFDDFDKEMVEDVFRNISKRLEKMNPQMSYTYTPGDEDAAAEEAAEYTVKKHA